MAPTERRAPRGRAAPRVASPGRASRDRKLDQPRRRPALPAGACFDLPQIGPTGIEKDRVGQRRERVRELGLEQHPAAAVEQRDPIAVGARDGRPSEGLRLRYDAGRRARYREGSRAGRRTVGGGPVLVAVPRPGEHEQDRRRGGGERDLEEASSAGTPRDRKSTRLNSSHITISYAVFCL